MERDSFIARSDDAKRYWLEEGWSPGGYVRTVTPAEYNTGVNPLFAGIRIVDCDTHFTEPADLFTKHAPAGMKSRMPFVKRVNGVDYWYVGDLSFGSIGGNVIGADNSKLLGRLAYQTFEEIHPGSYSVKERLKAMDAAGVWAHICFQNSGLTQAGSLAALTDREVALAVVKTYNDFCVEVTRESGNRIFPLALVPYWDKTETIKETRRVIDMGIKGIVMPDRPERIGPTGSSYVGPDGGVAPFWEEFFDICNATGTPLNFHLNAAIDKDSVMWTNLGFDQRLPMSALMGHMGCAATIANFMVSGLLDKYPKLKIGLIESGIGWVPFVLECMEHQMDEFRTAENRKLQRRPREYFEQFWVSYWFESYAPKHMIEEIGVNRIMFETDFPHPTSLYPGVQKKLVETLGDHTYEVRKRILERNAAELFNLPF